MSLILSAFLFLLSAWGSGVADSLLELAIYRIVGGLGVGIASMASPMYIAELAPARQRGFLVTLYQLAIVIGFFIVFLATYWIGGGTAETAEIHDYNVQEGWRMMFWSEVLPAGAFFALLFIIPKSPRWLVTQNKPEQALEILQKIMPVEEAKQEIKSIQDSLSSTETVSFGQLFSTQFRRVMILGILLSVFQQVTGINAILYYGAEIFSNALQYGAEDALKQQIWLGGTNLVCTFVAIFTVDKWGRRPLLLVGNIGMFVGLAGLTASVYFQQLGIGALVAILVFIGSFALSMGPVVWVLLSEIFPNKVRSMALSIAVAFQWLFNAIVANTFPIINRSDLNAESFNGALPYLLFTITAILSIVFIWQMIPETKNKSLEEIEQSWKS